MKRGAGLIVLADAPTELAKGQTVIEVPVARLDNGLVDSRYGRFSIKQSDFDSWQKNLHAVHGGRVPLDVDHSSDRAGSTERCCSARSS